MNKEVLHNAWRKREELRIIGDALRSLATSHYKEGNAILMRGPSAIGLKVLAEGNRTHAESDKNYADGNLIFLDAIISEYGDGTEVLQSNNGNEWTVNGEVFKEEA